MRALDSAAFGAARDRLIAWLLDVGDAVVFETPQGISGFAVRRPFGRGSVIGPLVATNENVAVALLRALLRPGFTRIDTPVTASRIAEAVTDAGLREVDTAIAMHRGRWPDVDSGCSTFALSTQALG